VIKAVFFLKRIPGITHEEFREHYENVHVKLAQKYLGHLMISYERNYVSEVRSSRSQGRQPVQWEFDCITEWKLPSQEAVDEVERIINDPQLGKEMYEDEENFLDRDKVVRLTFEDDDVTNTGTGGGHGTLG
jgi:EthD domain